MNSPATEIGFHKGRNAPNKQLGDDDNVYIGGGNIKVHKK